MSAPEAVDRGDSPQGSAFSPLRHRAFLVLWLATVASNIGTWMHDVGAGWLMTTMTSAPDQVALVQAATTMPVFLFALAAGAFADLLDRRRLLIAVQAGMAATALAVGLLTLWDQMTPHRLLALTFLLGTGSAFVFPAWQAIVPELIPRAELPAAVSLNSVGINISRAIGPAVGGVVIASLGIAWPFLLNVVSFLGVIAAVAWWRPRKAEPSPLPREHFFGAIRAGFRHSLRNPALRATLIRTFAFLFFASAYMAFLPLIAKEQLGGDAGFYGLLLAAVGLGAVGGALLLPRIRKAVGEEATTTGGIVGTAAILLAFALVESPALGLLTSVVAGACWIAVLASLNVSAQVSLPNWVRGRGLSVFLMVFFGSLTFGSVLWGQIAGAFGVPKTLILAASGLILGLVMTFRFKLHQGAELDLTPSAHWPAPWVQSVVDMDRGPVRVTIDYQVDPAWISEFLVLVRKLGHQRLREGAFEWEILEDVGAEGRYCETFLQESWVEHLRTHERTTRRLEEVQIGLRGCLADGEEPVVRHLVSA